MLKSPIQIDIANIITNCELINHKKLDYVNYCENIGDSIVGLPTLIIGWRFCCKIFDLELPILEKQKEKNTYWEFSPDEDIIQYTNGLDAFIKKVPTLFINRYNYINADPFNYKVYSQSDLENKLVNLKRGNLYVYKNDMAYYWVDNKIYGFKLSIYDAVIGENVTLNALKSISNNQIMDEGEVFQKYYKIFPDFQYLKRSIVVFAFS